MWWKCHKGRGRGRKEGRKEDRTPSPPPPEKKKKRPPSKSSSHRLKTKLSHTSNRTATQPMRRYGHIDIMTPEMERRQRLTRSATGNRRWWVIGSRMKTKTGLNPDRIPEPHRQRQKMPPCWMNFYGAKKERLQVDCKAFAKVIYGLAGSFSATISPATLDIWMEMLKADGITYQELQTGVQRLIREKTEGYGRLPLYGELLKAIKGNSPKSKTGPGLMRGQQDSDHLRLHGAGVWPEMSDPITRQAHDNRLALSNMGGPMC